MEATLKIGMPAGSLANVQRGGNLINLLASSGFKTSGYENGGPSKFSSMNFLVGWDGRPQEFGSQLGVNELDVAIAGDDWIKERMIELRLEYKLDIQLERVLSLNRGGVKIVGIINATEFNTTEEFLMDLSSRKKLITIVTEMPYLTLDWLQDKMRIIGLGAEYSQYSVQKYKTPAKIDKGIVVYETWGKTEAKVKNAGADLGVEITQTGSAIRNYGLKIIDTIMESQTSIWINPALRKNAEKNELLEMFLLNLYGSINAENKVMVMFNIGNDRIREVEDYLQRNNLFGDEPTVNAGHTYTEYNIQVDVDKQSNPIARVRYDLAKIGARSINTVPISSSIPGISLPD